MSLTNPAQNGCAQLLSLALLLGAFSHISSCRGLFRNQDIGVLECLECGATAMTKPLHSSKDLSASHEIIIVRFLNSCIGGAGHGEQSIFRELGIIPIRYRAPANEDGISTTSGSSSWCVSLGTGQSSFMLDVNIPEVCCLRPSWTVDESFQLRHQPCSWLCRHTDLLGGIVTKISANEEA